MSTVTITRHFHRHSSQTRADLQASFRLTPNQRESTGEFFYVRSDAPTIAFKTLKQAKLFTLESTQ